MTKVDCEDCYEKFPTKKLYITHVKSKTCTKSKTKKNSRSRPMAEVQVHEQDPKRLRLESGASTQDPLAMLGDGQAQPARLEELQGQIKNLTEDQKRALQEQITRKQRQVLQAIPYNQLSAKQKEILRKLSAVPAPAPAPVQVQNRTTNARGSRTPPPPTNSATTKYVTLKAGQVVNQPSKPAPAKRTSIQIVRKVQKKEPEMEVIRITKDTIFNDESIAADPQPWDPWAEEVDEEEPMEQEKTSVVPKIGSIKFKSFAKNFLQFENVLKDQTSTPASRSNTPTTRTDTPTGRTVTPTDSPTPTKQQATVKEACPKCKKIFSKSSIEAHIEAKHKIDCAKCEKRFLPEQLEEHMKSEHEMPREACKICDKVVYKQVLAQHIDIFHKAECKNCKTKYLLTELQAHVRNVHEKEGCNDCKARFETKVALAEHMDSTHLVERCEECGARFQTLQLLDTHVEHTHPKEYCEEEDCDDVFSTKGQLEAHKEKKHPNPNKFLTFGGGMFMMMMVPDDREDDDDDVGGMEEPTSKENETKAIEDMMSELILDLVKALPLELDVSKMCEEIVHGVCEEIQQVEEMEVVEQILEVAGKEDKEVLKVANEKVLEVAVEKEVTKESVEEREAGEVPKNDSLYLNLLGAEDVTMTEADDDDTDQPEEVLYWV